MENSLRFSSPWGVGSRRGAVAGCVRQGLQVAWPDRMCARQVGRDHISELAPLEAVGT